MEEKFPNPFEVLNERLRRIENLLSIILAENQTYNQQKSIPNSPKTIDLAVAVTGLKKKTIYNLAYKRLIPHSKRGKRLYFDEKELNEWIRRGKRKTLEKLGLIVKRAAALTFGQNQSSIGFHQKTKSSRDNLVNYSVSNHKKAVQIAVQYFYGQEISDDAHVLRS